MCHIRSRVLGWVLQGPFHQHRSPCKTPCCLMRGERSWHRSHAGMRCALGTQQWTRRTCHIVQSRKSCWIRQELMKAEGGGELPPQCCASHMLARRTTRSHPWRGLCSFHRWESISKPVAPQLNDEDEFAWLQDPTEPTLKYLTEENRYSANVMQPSATLVTAVYSEIRGRVVEPESSVPERCGDYYYYSRPSTAGDGFPLHCRTHAGPGGQFPGNGANENVILDPNELCSVLDCE
jgi:hypothetical protein